MSVAELPVSSGDRASHDRTPPQDIAAEQSVLGAMLLSKDAIADVVEVVRGHDFYRPAHETIFDTVIDLYGRGEPADAITVAAELTRRGELGRVGGAPYLHTLTASVPTAANAEYYAQIVRERAILRRLVEAGTRIVQMGYGSDGDVDDIVDRAQAEVYAVTDRRTSEDYAALAEIMESALDEIEAIGSRGGAMVGVPTGFEDLDRLTNGLHPGQLIIVAARPGLGKSTLGLDLARAAAIRHQLASVIFSLEMTRTEITMRLLSAEARVALHHMRTGQMSDDDWNRIARRTGEVSNAPLFIDDSPNMSMMEIRAKARRLRQRHDLRLLIVDYLQLMQSPKRVESRQVEVAEFSRSLKLLAKELEIPVVALSQLNRSPEQRADKKPMLSDLRESGCLTEDTTLLRADTGAPITFRQLLDSGHEGVLVWSFDEQRRLVAAPITNVFPSGVKRVYKLCLASGRQVKATGNHPFLSFAGWTRLDALAVGSRIAIPRRIPEPVGFGLGWSEHRLARLAHLLGDGCVLRSQPVHYTSNDAANRELGIDDPRAHEKRIPDVLYSASNAEIAVFLRHLWAADGSVTIARSRTTTAHEARYVTSSWELANGVLLLLSRFGIVARLQTVTKPSSRPWYIVVVADGPSLRTFCQHIGVHGRRGEIADRLLAGLADRADTPDLLGAAAANDVYWDRVIGIDPVGEQPVYDATVKGTHNFIANGIAAHNSIEQDSDMVILLHREDAYEKDSPRAGEADLIVAKHRNGPTATITVAFQGHYSRFVDMAPA